MSEEQIKKAEAEVKQRSEEFNQVIDSIEEKIAHGAERVGKIMDTVKKPKLVVENLYEDTRRLVKETEKAASELFPEEMKVASEFIKKTQDAVEPVLKDPRFQLALTAVIFGSIGFMIGRKSST